MLEMVMADGKPNFNQQESSSPFSYVRNRSKGGATRKISNSLTKMDRLRPK